MPPRKKPAVFAFIGDSGSGKTTLIEALVRELKSRGVHVCVVKNTHKEVETDAPGKDSWRLKEAGADVVVLNSPRRFVVSRSVRGRASVLEIRAKLSGLVDIILMEGTGEDAGMLPCVEVAPNGPSKRFSREKRIAFVSGKKIEGAKCFGFDEIAALADFLLTYRKRPP
jgi:molybdopterin-guanine dinucleotide biosynthesis protein MobB